MASEKTKKLNIGIVFGGRSAEHKVSLQSAKSIIEAIDTRQYNPILLGISPNGRWFLNDISDYLKAENDPTHIELNEDAPQVGLISSDQAGHLIGVDQAIDIAHIDVLFPVLHGPFGEDGAIQGLAKLAGIPCVGSGILGSAAGMDKDFTKRLLRHEGLNVAAHVIARNGHLSEHDLNTIENDFGYPVFVKPANMGSSIGVSRASNQQELLDALETATAYDKKVLIEAAIVGREIECAVLGNDSPSASIPGEVASTHAFYDYDSKYVDKFGAKLSIPAQLTEAQTLEIQSVSKQVFTTLECRGLTRVDVFLTEDNEIFINEVNTLPGFTKISMYPKLWEHSGLSYPELIDQLIKLAIEDF